MDSDEGGRWQPGGIPSTWQTDGIAALAREGDVCLFVTYGYSEFFTKWFEPGPAAAASGFRHIRLDDLAALVDLATPLLSNASLYEWLAALHLEQTKRQTVPDVLALYATFRRAYLDIGKQVDFDVRRFGVNAPEMAFPALDRLRRAWNELPCAGRHGHLALYPVNRQFVALPDSILNWRELWREGGGLLLGGAIPIGKQALYFEVNEDFNLHLKLASDDDGIVAEVRAEVARRIGTATRTPGLVAFRPEFHRQGTYAVWEWDLDLPALIARDSAGPAAEALGTLLDEVIPRLA